jgi:hypothetical protein
MWCKANVVVMVLLVAAGCRGPEPPLTDEAKRAKGDALVKKMSDKLAGLHTFSYRADQELERVNAKGEKSVFKFTRNTTLRRPNALVFAESGGERDSKAWYDGKQVTVISNRDKVWVRGPMPPTLDEALDFVSAEYDIEIATADLLYSNPYDALMTADTKGGWVKVEQIGNRACDHVAYQATETDWQLWLNQANSLPCQLEITYKTATGQPKTKVVFSELNEAPAVTDATFTPAVPDGYTRIKLMRHATVVDEKASEEPGGKK